MSQSSLPSEILKLSIPQRVHLVEQIWDSIVDEEHSFELSEAKKKNWIAVLMITTKIPQVGLAGRISSKNCAATDGLPCDCQAGC